MKKIGLLGGTFDPIHNGHLQLAEAALAECELDRVVFIPAAEPPHKNRASITSFKHRLAMLALTVEEREEFEVNSIEGLLAKPSYTVDTLRVLRKHYPKEFRLYFLIGADAFLDILSWKAHWEVLCTVNFIVSHRKGYKTDQLAELLSNLGYKVKAKFWCCDRGGRDIRILDKVPVEMSSSSIRQKNINGQDVSGLMPLAVIEYIKHHNLYQQVR